jgi:hypothetical protein
MIRDFRDDGAGRIADFTQCSWCSQRIVRLALGFPWRLVRDLNAQSESRRDVKRVDFASCAGPFCLGYHLLFKRKALGRPQEVEWRNSI